ncbi:MAG: cyclic nucleotide-binding domain-containing protein [Gammaproteobacteria bacterium]|nr:cyclic nucleotide-binding domain-containing protein [Gammaproteobacteria bacterium]MBU1654499.1 cyclic nucleotide-binding domain-containing protein [Gammaproteobacteria bacterium]MBU1960686.1 cyclic nucleotide-binding domain-containing protein [Gammaproteobacteria bacterium]
MPVTADMLRDLVPLIRLNEEALNQLAQQSILLEMVQGDRVFDVDSEDDFIYYLLDGRVRMIDRVGVESLLSADNRQTRFAFGKLKPRPAEAVIDSETARVLMVYESELERLITWHEQLSIHDDSALSLPDVNSGLLVSELQIEDPQLTDNNWMLTLLRSRTFHKVPPENVQKLVEKMEPVLYPAGETVIRQGEPGDNYYVIREGQCRVLSNGVEVGQLGLLDTFGEEALLSGGARNATVEMITDGLLMQLSRESFNELLIKPLVKRASLGEVKYLAQKGAILIDVRTRREFLEQRLVRSINIPLFVLRAKFRKLKRDKTYIVYCDTGTRSSAATFLLAREGYEAYLLADPQRAFQIMAAKQE